jgi:hypothetical protein
MLMQRHDLFSGPWHVATVLVRIPLCTLSGMCGSVQGIDVAFNLILALCHALAGASICQMASPRETCV